jgi:hypothetical protein
MQVDDHPPSSPLILSNDALPDSTISPATATTPAMAMTPAAVLGETRKRKNGHQKSKKPRKKQKKSIASDGEEDGEGSQSDSDSAHSSNSDQDEHDSDNDGEPTPHSMRRRSARGSASVATVPRGTISPVEVGSLQETVSVTSPARLPASRPDEPSIQQASNSPAQPAPSVASPVPSPQPTPPITTARLPASGADELSVQQASNALAQPAHTITSPIPSSQPTPPIATACLPTSHAEEPSVQQSSNAPAQPAHAFSSHMFSSPVPSLQPTPHIATHPAIIVENSWPDWFVKAHEHLTGPDLGPAFEGIISKYVAFEKLAGFSPERRNAGFGSKNRPSQVAWWVGCGRKATPKITDIPGFAKQWWLWWKGLQPTWRNIASAQGPLTLAHRAVVDGEGGWVDVERHGQNAFYTILATLRWWGAALGDACKEDEEWLSAGVDVEWVLSNLLER